MLLAAGSMAGGCRVPQDKWTQKVRTEDLPPELNSDGAAIGWHSDGPVGFPEVHSFGIDTWQSNCAFDSHSECVLRRSARGVNVQISGHVPMHTLRFGYFLTDATHPGSGTVENIRGSHRSMRNCTLLLSIFRRGPIQTH
jgi:hypothetical protein